MKLYWRKEFLQWLSQILAGKNINVEGDYNDH